MTHLVEDINIQNIYMHIEIYSFSDLINIRQYMDCHIYLFEKQSTSGGIKGGSILHGGPIELFLDPASAPRLI